MIQTLFNVIATAIILFLAVIWNKNTAADTILKYGLVSVSLFGIFVCLHNLGYIIKF